MRIFLIAFLAVFCAAAHAQVPAVLRNEFTTNSNPNARMVVTNIVNSLVSTGGISTTTATNIANTIVSQYATNQPSLNLLDFTSMSNTSPAITLRGIEGKAYRVIGGSSNYSQITNGAYQVAFKSAGSGAIATYILGTNSQQLAAIGATFSITNATGASDSPAIIFLTQTNSMDSAGTLALSGGFHVVINVTGVDIQFYTNGIVTAVSAGIVPWNRWDYDGANRSVSVIFNGNNTVSVKGDGISGTVTNSRIESLRGAAGSPTYFAWEQYSTGSNILYQPAFKTVWAASAPSWNEIRSVQSARINIDGDQYARWGSNYQVHLGRNSAPVGDTYFWVSNSTKVLQITTNGSVAIARGYKPDATIPAPLTIYAPAGSGGGQIQIDSTADSQNAGVRYNRDQAAKWFTGLLGNSSAFAFYSDNGGGTRFTMDESGNSMHIGNLTNSGNFYNGGLLSNVGAAHIVGNLTGAGNASFTGGSATIAAGGAYRFNGRSAITSPSDGVIGLGNNALSSFNLLGFGGQIGISNSANGFEFVNSTAGARTNIYAKGISGESLTLSGTSASTMLMGTQNVSGVQVIAPSISVTNGLGVLFFASSSVQEVDPRNYNDWQMTNNAGAAITLVFTNYNAGQWGSVKLPGAASGGSDYAVTVVPQTSTFVRFHFPTNGATTFTRTNGQDCQLEYWVTRLNTTNVLNCALGRANQ